MKLTTWILIVNYRTPDMVADCLASLSDQVDDLGGGKVVVLDNASGDGSVEQIAAVIEQHDWGKWARVLLLDCNGGFAFGNNAGISMALTVPSPPDYVLLLNPDTIARQGAVRALIEFMEVHPRVGIAGSRLENASGGVECSAHRVLSPLGELNGSARLGILSRVLQRYVVSPPVRDEAHECDWVSGASMLVRRHVLEQIGPMDDGFFLYFEEVDYCLRAKKAGWSVWYVPESRVLHLEGASTGINAPIKRRAAYWYDSRRRFFLKHHGLGGLVLADLLWAIGRVSFLLRKKLRLGGGNGQDPKWFMWDLLWGDLCAIINGQARSVRRAGERL